MKNSESEDCDPSTDRMLVLLDECREMIELRQYGESDQIFAEMMELVVQDASENPTPDMLLQAEAHHFEEAANWQSAENAYLKLLEMALTTGEPAAAYTAHRDLANFYWLVGNDFKAFDHSCSAAEAASRYDLMLLSVMALDLKACCALRLGMVTSALHEIAKAISYLDTDAMHDMLRGRCLVIRADCHLRVKHLANAIHDLESARQLLDAQSEMDLAAGVHSAIAKWWSIKADVLASQGDFTEAWRAWEQAIASRRHVAELPQAMGPHTKNSLAETIFAFGRALKAAGYEQQAIETFMESNFIRHRIGLPSFTR